MRQDREHEYMRITADDYRLIAEGMAVRSSLEWIRNLLDCSGALNIAVSQASDVDWTKVAPMDLTYAVKITACFRRDGMVHGPCQVWVVGTVDRNGCEHVCIEDATRSRFLWCARAEDRQKHGIIRFDP